MNLTKSSSFLILILLVHCDLIYPYRVIRFEGDAAVFFFKILIMVWNILILFALSAIPSPSVLELRKNVSHKIHFSGTGSIFFLLIS